MSAALDQVEATADWLDGEIGRLCAAANEAAEDDAAPDAFFDLADRGLELLGRLNALSADCRRITEQHQDP